MSAYRLKDFAEAAPPEYVHIFEAAFRERLCPQYAMYRHNMILSFNKAAIGIVTVVPLGCYERTCYIANVAIRPDLQRQHHGTMLMRLVENWARAEKFFRLSLHVKQRKKDFYETCGFKIQYHAVVDDQACLYMTKSL